jgi:bifunctional NMN adenylyltransferase/nudix hydrolase
LWALPGGYIDTRETLKQSSLRELKEETKIDVPLPVLAGSIVKQKTYDYPSRSLRGRIITECFHYRLNDNFELPKIKGSDDARKAFWLPFAEVVKNSDNFFEDHYDIIEDMIGL